MKELWRGRVRVYFNAFEEAPLVWSVDNGDPANEVKTHLVTIYPPASTETGPRQIQPKAWMELKHAARVVLHKDSSIVVDFI